MLCHSAFGRVHAADTIQVIDAVELFDDRALSEEPLLFSPTMFVKCSHTLNYNIL